MSTVFELPDQLDLPEADQSQADNADVCDALAESDTTAEPSDANDAEGEEPGESREAEEWSSDDVVEVTDANVMPDTPKPVTTAADVTSYTGYSTYSDYDGHLDLLQQIRDAAADCRRAASRIESIKAEMKEAKGTHEKALLDLQQLCMELIEPVQSQPKQWRSDCKPLAITPASSASSEAQSTPIQYDSTQPVFGGLVDQPTSGELAEYSASESSTRDTEQDDLAWRSVPIAELNLESIKGLGQKKREALIDLVPTIGALEDLRARVGRDASSLPELMPKGIGRAACDQLEELVLSWLAKRPPVQVQPSSQVEQIPVEQLSHEDQVSQRAAELDDGKPNCLARKQQDDGIWKAGYRAAEDDVSLWECPWTVGENQDEWIRGYLAQKAIDVYDRNQASRANDLDEL